MITLKLSGVWLGKFLTHRMFYSPILIKEGLPQEAKFLNASVQEDGCVHFRYEAPGPDKVMEAELCNVVDAEERVGHT